MASYRITALPSTELDHTTIRECSEARSAFGCEKPLRHGTLPDTFTTTPEGLCWVVYAEESEYEKETLNGTETTTVAEKYTIIFLGNGYIAYEYCTQEVEQDILSVVGATIEEGVRLEPIIFDESALQRVIDQSETVRRVDIAPARKEAPDLVTGRDRMDLRQTDWWDQNTADPFEQIKVDLPTEDAEFDVGFDDRGKVVLYGKNIDQRTQAQILRYVSDEIIDAYVDTGSFQSNNWF